MQEASQLELETSVPADNANSLQRCHSRSHQSPERSEKQLTKQLNVDLLECVDTTELVKLMVNLVEDESFVIVSSVVLHYVIYCKRSATDINSWDREYHRAGWVLAGPSRSLGCSSLWGNFHPLGCCPLLLVLSAFIQASWGCSTQVWSCGGSALLPGGL